MSFSQPFSYSYHSNHEKADDSSTVFDADTVIPDEVPSVPAMPPLPMLTATATTTNYYHQQPHNNNETISSISHSSQEESPANTISELLRLINSRHRPATITTTATATATAPVYDANTVMPGQEESPVTATRSKETDISTNESSSSSSSKKRPITNSSSYSSRKKTRQSSRLKRQQPQDQSLVDNSDSEVEDENIFEDYEPDEAVINQTSSSQTSTKRQRQNEAKWRSKFEELCDYKRLHGNVNVPRSNKQLVNWVSNQRAEYKKFKANKKAYINKDRIQTLESIGFEWVGPNQGGQRNESAWNKRFNELKEYKEEYERTNVPQHFKDNKELGVWVNKQRKEYKKFKENKKSQITPERIDLLNSIGFQWECRSARAPRS